MMTVDEYKRLKEEYITGTWRDVPTTKPFNEHHFVDGPTRCFACNRDIPTGMRHYPGKCGCWVGMIVDGVPKLEEPKPEPKPEPAPAPEPEPEIEPDPPVPTHRCIECGEEYHGEPLFDGLATKHPSRWIMWRGELRHMHGYAGEPRKTVEVNVWA